MVKLKTKAILDVYAILKDAKLNKLDGDDKVKVWKMTRIMRPTAEQFEADVQDAIKKMKPSEDFDEKVRKAQEYEQAIRSKVPQSELPLKPLEYFTIIKSIRTYNEDVAKATESFGEKEVELNIDLLPEKAFESLFTSNDWTASQAMLCEVICE